MATSSFYGRYFESLLKGKLALDTDPVKVMLCTHDYVPDRDTHTHKSDITNEVAGAGYTAGGLTLAPVTLAYDAGTDTASFDGPDAVWTPLTVTDARIAVVYAAKGSDATSPLIGWVDFGENKTLAAGTLKIIWPGSGIGAVAVP